MRRGDFGSVTRDGSQSVPGVVSGGAFAPARCQCVGGVTMRARACDFVNFRWKSPRDNQLINPNAVPFRVPANRYDVGLLLFCVVGYIVVRKVHGLPSWSLRLSPCWCDWNGGDCV